MDHEEQATGYLPGQHESNFLLQKERQVKKDLQDLETPDNSAKLMFPESSLGKGLPKSAPATLFQQSYLLVLALLYTCLSMFAWVIICVQTRRPITTRTYSYVFNSDYYFKRKLEARMKQNAAWFRVVKVLLSITNTLIIPLTSTVCASAAVIYVQNFGNRRHFSMQKTSTLADKGWTSPHVWLALLSIKSWRTRGSEFLAFAMAFHALGFLIGPLQQYYIGQESSKFQTFHTFGLQEGTDVYDLFGPYNLGLDQLPIVRLRDQLSLVSSKDYQPNLWQEGIPHCTPQNFSDSELSHECYQGGTTFENISQLLHPYSAELPSGYQTGLISQYMPRINSSISYDTVPSAEFPQVCDAIAGGYYIRYTADKALPAQFHSKTLVNKTVLDVQICMPSDISQSPWKATRDRQDITEEMFLNITFGTSIVTATGAKPPDNATFKLVVNSTLGYFELPNYNNSGVAGPLLAEDPHIVCQDVKDQCISQWHPKRSLQINESVSSFEADRKPNQGPLAMLAVALFDAGSFFAAQFPKNETKRPDNFDPHPDNPCTVPPLNLLFGRSAKGDCSPNPYDDDDGIAYASTWLNNFYSLQLMQNALHAAVILASRSWLMSPTREGTLSVVYDMGLDSERPKISHVGVILLSILLAIDLSLLLALAVYIRFSHTWTAAFDSSAMMRFGAARPHELPLQIGSYEAEEETRRVLEQMPGWVGDARPGDDVGVLAIGATEPLRSGRKYRGL